MIVIIFSFCLSYAVSPAVSGFPVPVSRLICSQKPGPDQVSKNLNV